MFVMVLIINQGGSVTTNKAFFIKYTDNLADTIYELKLHEGFNTWILL